VRQVRGFALTASVLVLGASLAAAQGTTGVTPATPKSTAVVERADQPAWPCSASLFGYLVPEDQDYVQPTFAADHGRLHLEARYNYESLQTGSAWLGYAFSAGRKLRLDITPMLGGVFGVIHGVAAGYGLTLGWSSLEFDSEGEYFFDAGDNSGDFFYSWSELSISPRDTWRAGLAAQRTRTYDTGLEVQRGFLAGVSYKRLDVTTYVFNLGWEDPTVVLAAEVGF
jgi:hypothetical protein